LRLPCPFRNLALFWPGISGRVGLESRLDCLDPDLDVEREPWRDVDDRLFIKKNNQKANMRLPFDS